MKALAGRICVLLITCAIAADAACDESNSAVFQPQTNFCPVVPSGVEAVAAPSESECVLRCTLSSNCRLSVYLRDSATCYSLTDVMSTGSCNSRVIARRKLPPASTHEWLSLSFSPQIVLFYNFRKSFKNLADPCRNEAEPVNTAEQNSIDGVRLQGSSSSYVKVSTPGFYKYFNYGQKFSIFFQGTFGMNNSKKCFSAFVDVARNDMYTSTLHADGNGRISAKFFFPSGEPLFRHWTSKDALTVDSVQRVASIGINFDGQDFATTAYFNGSAVARGSWGGGPQNSAPRSRFTIHDELLIGNCMIKSGVEPFDGWLQCWALLTGNLDESQFDELRSLCNT